MSTANTGTSSSIIPQDIHNDLLNEFLLECGENLASLDQHLVRIENQPKDIETLKVILRVFHSIKGACGIFSFSRMEKLSHACEDLLVEVRDGRMQISREMIAPILKAIDRLRAGLMEVEQSQREPEGDDQDILSELSALAAEPSIHQTVSDSSPQATPQNTPSNLNPNPTQSPGTSVMDQTLRVHVDILERLMNLVGELVLSRNQLLQLSHSVENSLFQAPIQSLNRITSGLQEAVMRTRMQPIGNTWSKFPRIVRDLESTLGKEIELVMQGAETEIDRQILQALQDPLVHCVRNAADHGLESPAARVAAGKKAKGQILLKSYQEGGQINIEISDDGKGIPVDVIRKKGIERGLISVDRAAQATETEILNLIFEPGFSTAEKVTEVSGRGVGLDVVKSNIEKAGGTVDIQTRIGVGTTLRIRIPLTLAIVPALIVGVGGQSLAIPQISVIELVRISESSGNRVESIHGVEILRLRDQLLPLTSLARVLGIQERLTRSDDPFVVLVQVNDQPVGLVVDEIFDTQEIVVKPVGSLIRDVDLYAGSTILGNGKVIMILDAAGVAKRAHPHSRIPDRTAQKSSERDPLPGTEKASFLVFRNGSPSPQAVPLALVARLEEFPSEKIEWAGDQLLVQYRGGLLPLVSSSSLLQMQVTQRDTNRTFPVIVFSNGERSMGILVDEIIDIVETSVQLSGGRKTPGVLGVSVMEEHATEVIDTYYYIRQACPDWMELTEELQIGRMR